MRHVSRQGTLRGESAPSSSADTTDCGGNLPAARSLLKRRAEQVRRSEQAFRDVVVKGWDGALVLDKHGYVRFLNEAAKEILGPRSERLVGANFGLPVVGRRGVEIEIARGPADDRIAEMRVIDGPWDGERARIVLMRDITETRSQSGDDRASITWAVQQTTRALTDQGTERASAEELAQRLCNALFELTPTTSVHTYLRTASGDFLHVAEAGPDADGTGLPERFSTFEVDELLNGAEDATVVGSASGEGHSFVTRLAARMRLDWLLVHGLRHEGETIGLQIIGGAECPRIRAKRIVQESSRVAGLAIGGALLRREISRLERARSEILSMVSHELRSPLHVILGYESLLREGGLGELSNEQHDALVRIGRNAQQLAGLIENTLTASRENTEQLPGGTREVRPCDITIDIQDEMSALYEDEDLEILWDIPENLPRLYTEPDKLKIILRNLVSNAVKFTDEGTVEISAERFGGGLAITVADTGVGIPADQLETIFEEFRQAMPEDGKARGGVGLGLYIVRRMTEKLEGTISVVSEPGEGSAFTVWLPLRVGAVHAAA